MCFQRFKSTAGVSGGGEETLNSYGVTVTFSSSRSANQTDLSKRMLCLEDDSWAADILFLSESDAFGRRPMMGAFWAATRKRSATENITQYTEKKNIE